MDGKTQLIKNAVAKIDIDKIINYQQEYPESKTLRRIVNCSKKVQERNSEQEIVKLGTDLAYYLDVICDSSKGGYVKNEDEKQYWLEISRRLFENTVGIREKN